MKLTDISEFLKELDAASAGEYDPTNRLTIYRQSGALFIRLNGMREGREYEAARAVLFETMDALENSGFDILAADLAAMGVEIDNHFHRV